MCVRRSPTRRSFLSGTDPSAGSFSLVPDSTIRTAQDLFAPLAPGYERWADILSLGQDRRWRQRMIASVDFNRGAEALDIAAGTGSITRLLQARGARVVSLDQSEQMLRMAIDRGAVGVLATGEALPFPDASFDVVTFGYLLRYVGSVEGCMAQIARVLEVGGRVGMVEFGRPRSLWRPLWWGYTRLVLPAAGLVAGHGWSRVGRFLGPSIDDFASQYPPSRLVEIWEAAGFREVTVERLSLGGGLVMTGRKA